MMRALHALQRSYNAFPLNARQSFSTIFVRPDLDIIDDLDLEFLLSHAYEFRLLFLDGSFLVVSTTALRLLLPEKLLMPMPTASTVFQYLSLTGRPFH